LQLLLQNIINGLALGSVYALVALGYTMVYGVLQFINFAHSDIFMLGAFAGLYVAGWISGIFSPTVEFAIVMSASMFFCVICGVLAERVAYRPLRSAPRLNVLITAIGVSLFLENLGQIVFGSDPRVFPSLLPVISLLEAQDLVLNNIQVIVISVSAAFMFILSYIVHRTKIGTAMRAVSYDIQVASLMGIPSDWIIIFTFVIGSALAGIASVLYGLAYPRVDPLMGVMIGLKAFVAAVFGGIGNIAGAAIGGIILGLAEALVVYYVSSSFRDAIAFGILILVLLFRPTGIFGTMQREKV